MLDSPLSMSFRIAILKCNRIFLLPKDPIESFKVWEITIGMRVSHGGKNKGILERLGVLENRDKEKAKLRSEGQQQWGQEVNK